LCRTYFQLISNLPSHYQEIPHCQLSQSVSSPTHCLTFSGSAYQSHSHCCATPS
jgi:hypothetical protein